MAIVFALLLLSQLPHVTVPDPQHVTPVKTASGTRRRRVR